MLVEKINWKCWLDVDRQNFFGRHRSASVGPASVHTSRMPGSFYWTGWCHPIFGPCVRPFRFLTQSAEWMEESTLLTIVFRQQQHPWMPEYLHSCCIWLEAVTIQLIIFHLSPAFFKSTLVSQMMPTGPTTARILAGSARVSRISSRVWPGLHYISLSTKIAGSTEAGYNGELHSCPLFKKKKHLCMYGPI